MRRLSVSALAVALVLGGSFFLYRHFRILPLESVRQPHPVVLSAESAGCTPSQPLYRIVVLQTNPGLEMLRINSMDLPLSRLHDVLSNILRTRMDRTIYLVDNSAADHHASAVLEKMVEQLPVVDRVCIINPNHPPAWYPPGPFPGAGGGAEVAF